MSSRTRKKIYYAEFRGTVVTEGGFTAVSSGKQKFSIWAGQVFLFQAVEGPRPGARDRIWNIIIHRGIITMR